MRMALHTQILIGAVIGAGLGGAAHALWHDAKALDDIIHYVARPIGQVFLSLLLMLVLPLIFSALVLGVSEFSDLRRLSRVGLKTLAYTVAVSSIAVMLGIGLVQWVQPGSGITEEQRTALIERATAEQRAAPTAAPTGIDLFVKIVPQNVANAAADGDYLAWMFFSLMFGLGICLTRTAAVDHLRTVIQGLFDVSMRLIMLVLRLAPIGVAALLFQTTADLGYGWLVQLSKYVGVVLAALLIHQCIVYSLAIKVLGGMSPLRFFRDVREAMITAFSTASSNATLPTALRVAEQNLQLPREVSRFVLTVGATANQNGTALFEGVTVLFLAQLYGVELTAAKQIIVVLMCILGGIGTAGVPGGSLPVVVTILGMVGVPQEGIAVVLGVDRLLDMCRTTLNVTGDLAAAVVVSRGEDLTPEINT